VECQLWLMTSARSLRMWRWPWELLDRGREARRPRSSREYVRLESQNAVAAHAGARRAQRQRSHVLERSRGGPDVDQRSNCFPTKHLRTCYWVTGTKPSADEAADRSEPRSPGRVGTVHALVVRDIKDDPRSGS